MIRGRRKGKGDLREGEGMTVRFLDDRGVWDRFIDESPSGLLFHKWDYLHLTAKHSGCMLLPYGIYKGDELICVFPLFNKQKHGLNAVFSPPPLTVIPHLGCIMSGGFDALKQSKKEIFLNLVADEMQQEIQRLSPNYLSVTFVPDFNDIRQYLRDGYDTKIRYTYTINLNHSIDQLWNNLHYKLRNKLKREAGAGLRLEKSTDISAFYQLLSERYSDPSLNIPIIKREYLKDLMHAYPEEIGVYYLYDAQGEVVGVVTTQEYKRFLLWMGTPRLDGDHSGNEYLQWLLIQRAKSEEYRIFENMGANNRDLVFFKSKFNPDLTLYFEISKRDTLGAISEWTYCTFLKKVLMAFGRV
jgi:hypothetical protein